RRVVGELGASQHVVPAKAGTVAAQERCLRSNRALRDLTIARPLPSVWVPRFSRGRQDWRVMTTKSPRRIAILGVHLESNAFAPVTREQDFRSLCYLEGDAILAEAKRPAPALPAEVSAFVAEMDRIGPWTPVPIVVAAAEPGGPVDGPFLSMLLA